VRVRTCIFSLQRGSLQHYYETFQDLQGDSGKEKLDGTTQRDKDLDNVVLLYAGFSAVQAKDRSVKSGPLLHLKRERRMFAPFKVFWLNRWCWVSFSVPLRVYPIRERLFFNHGILSTYLPCTIKGLCLYF
jgi:hypothetical protein